MTTESSLLSCPSCSAEVAVSEVACPICGKGFRKVIGLGGPVVDERRRYQLARLLEKELGPGSFLRLHKELALARPRIAEATDPLQVARILEILQGFGEVGLIEGVRGRKEQLRGWWSTPQNRIMAGVAAAVVLVTLSLLADLVAELRGGRQVVDTGQAPLGATLAFHRLEAALVAVKCGRHSSLGFYVEEDVIATIGQTLCPAGRRVQAYNAIRGNLAATTTYRDDLLDLAFLDVADTGVPLRALDVESIAQGDVVYPAVLTSASAYALHRTHVQSVDRQLFGVRYLQIVGDSSLSGVRVGSPVLSRSGLVVGLVADQTESGYLVLPSNYLFAGDSPLAGRGFVLSEAWRQSVEKASKSADLDRRRVSGAVVRLPEILEVRRPDRARLEVTLVLPTNGDQSYRTTTFNFLLDGSVACRLTARTTQWRDYLVPNARERAVLTGPGFDLAYLAQASLDLTECGLELAALAPAMIEMAGAGAGIPSISMPAIDFRASDDRQRGRP